MSDTGSASTEVATPMQSTRQMGEATRKRVLSPKSQPRVGDGKDLLGVVPPISH